jgi:hypothetical protein
MITTFAPPIRAIPLWVANIFPSHVMTTMLVLRIRVVQWEGANTLPSLAMMEMHALRIVAILSLGASIPASLVKMGMYALPILVTLRLGVNIFQWSHAIDARSMAEATRCVTLPTNAIPSLAIQPLANVSSTPSLARMEIHAPSILAIPRLEIVSSQKRCAMIMTFVPSIHAVKSRVPFLLCFVGSSCRPMRLYCHQMQ